MPPSFCLPLSANGPENGAINPTLIVSSACAAKAVNPNTPKAANRNILASFIFPPWWPAAAGRVDEQIKGACKMIGSEQTCIRRQNANFDFNAIDQKAS